MRTITLKLFLFLFLGIMLLTCNLPLVLAQNIQEVEKQINKRFRPGSYLKVKLDLPEKQYAKILTVRVTWQDSNEETAGQLYIDYHPFDFEREIPAFWSQEYWNDINMNGRFVMIKFINISDNQKARGARVSKIAIKYEYPLPD